MSDRIIATTPQQDAAVLEKYDGESPFTTHDLFDEDNQSDLQDWVDKRELGGIVDEACGGIIGYVNYAHLDRIVALLNAAAAAQSEVSK